MRDVHSIEPDARTRAFARNLYQVYAALVVEGFTEAQALHIIGGLIEAQVGNIDGPAED